MKKCSILGFHKEQLENWALDLKAINFRFPQKLLKVLDIETPTCTV